MTWKIRHIPKNTKGRDFIVGDLYGRYDELMLKLSKIGFDFESDRLFCCGDLIDRGPKSMECLELMYEPWFFSVRGNHEQMMIDALVHNIPDGGHWFANGGLWLFDHNQMDVVLMAQEADRMLPYQIQVGNIGIVHADVGNRWRDLDEEEYVNALWCRDRFLKGGYGRDVEGIARLYVGHTWREGDGRIDNVVYMDNKWDEGLIIEEMREDDAGDKE